MLYWRAYFYLTWFTRCVFMESRIWLFQFKIIAGYTYSNSSIFFHRLNWKCSKKKPWRSKTAFLMSKSTDKRPNRLSMRWKKQLVVLSTVSSRLKTNTHSHSKISGLEEEPNKAELTLKNRSRDYESNIFKIIASFQALF